MSLRHASVTAVALLVALTACDCDRRTLESRLDALDEEALAALEGVQLPTVPDGHSVSPMGSTATRVIVTTDHAILDPSPTIRGELGELERGGELPAAPSSLHTLAELDDGRLTGPVITAAREPGPNVVVDVYADRRVRWPVIQELVRALVSAGYLDVHFAIRGPARLPIHRIEIGERQCVLGAQLGLGAAEPTAETITPLAPLQPPDPAAHPCRSQRGVGVEIRDSGHWVRTGQGVLTPACTEVRTGGPDVPTIQRRGEAFDHDALRTCLRRLRELSPNDVYVQLSANGEGFTLSDYVETWSSLRGEPSAPIFEGVY